jgi:hypothetical protein
MLPTYIDARNSELRRALVRRLSGEHEASAAVASPYELLTLV